MKDARIEDLVGAPTVPEFLQRWTAVVIEFWRYPILNHWTMRATLLVFISAFCVTRAYIGLTGTQKYSHDAFMLLDGAWRMHNGQRPHIDFYSHVGVLTFAPTLLGLKVTHGTPAAFGYGQAITGLVLGVWAYLLGRRVLSDIAAVALSLVTTMITAAPSLLGFQPFMLAPAMTYNRAGYALLGLIFVEVLAAPSSDERSRRESRLFGFSTGVALSLLLFLKITYFAFGLLFVAVMILLRPFEKRRATGIVAGFCLVSLICSAYFRFNLLPMLRDLLTVGASKHVNLGWYLMDDILVQAGGAFVLSLMGALVLFSHGKLQSARFLVIGCSAVCAIGALLILGNYEQSGFPLAVFVAIIVADQLTSQIASAKNSLALWRALTLLFSSVILVVFVATNVAVMCYGWDVRTYWIPTYAGLSSDVLGTFVPIDGDRTYKYFADDGLSLVERLRHDGETIMSLDFTNPFSYGFSARPAPGGTTVLQYGTTFNDNHCQSAENLFGAADLVAVPQEGRFSDDSLNSNMMRIYGRYLNRHFAFIGESRYWRLYRRRKA